MEWIMWRTGSKKMNSICCTIYEEQSLVYWTVCEAQSAQYARRKFIDMLKIDCFARKNQFTGALLALHANIWLYGRIFHNNRIFLQNINNCDRIRFETAQYCSFVSKSWTGISVHGDAEQEVVSHPFPPALPLVCAASVLPFNTNCTVVLPA